MATFTAKGGKIKYYTFTVTVNETDVDIANNQSTIEYSATLTASSGYWFQLHTCTRNMYIDGVACGQQKGTLSIDKGETMNIYTKGTKVITHDDDGSKTIAIKFTWSDTYSSTYNYMPGATTVTGSFKLTTIPRASSVSCPSFNIGDTPTITITPQLTGVTHTITYKFGAITETTMATNISDLSIPWDTSTLAASMYAATPNSNTLPVTINCTTYKDGVQIGSIKTITANALVTNSDPVNTITVTADDYSQSLTGSPNIMINNISTPVFKVVATPKNSATISQINYFSSDVSINEQNLPTTTGAITINETFPRIKHAANGPGYEITVQTVDSRNNEDVDYSQWLTGSTFIDYTLPQIVAFTADRNNATATTVEFSGTIKYWTGNFGAKTNAASVQVQYSSDNGQTWSNVATSSVTLSGTTVTGTQTGINEDANYLFRLQVSDITTTTISVNSATQLATVEKSIPYIDMTEKAITINVPTTINYQLQSISGIVDNADANNYTYSGMYALGTNCTNVPASYIKLYVNGNGTGDISQIAATLNATSPQVFSRQRINGSWTTWLYMTSYPIGSVVMTSTNTNPSIYYGGTWTLIDKEFAPKDVGDVIQMNSTNTSACHAYGKRGGHSITFNGTFTNKVALTDDTFALGTFTSTMLTTMGVTDLPDSKRTVGFSDGGNSEVFLLIDNSDNTLYSVDIGGNITSVAASKTWFWSGTFTWDDPSQMLDSACDKFYWRRTA